MYFVVNVNIYFVNFRSTSNIAANKISVFNLKYEDLLEKIFWDEVKEYLNWLLQPLKNIFQNVQTFGKTYFFDVFFHFLAVKFFLHASAAKVVFLYLCFFYTPIENLEENVMNNRNYLICQSHTKRLWCSALKFRIFYGRNFYQGFLGIETFCKIFCEVTGVNSLNADLFSFHR